MNSYTRVVISFVIVCVVLFISIFGIGAFAQEETPASWHGVSGTSENRILFDKYEYQEDDIFLEFENLDLDATAIDGHSFPVWVRMPSLDQMTRYLLQNELADITSLVEADPDYVEIYLKTDRARIRYPDAFDRPEGNQGTEEPSTNLLINLWNLIISFWQIILAIIALISVRLLYEIYKRWRDSRNVTTMFVGLPAAGKSALALRLADPMASEKQIADLTATVGEDFNRVDDFHLAELVFKPMNLDIAGSEPERIIDYLHSFSKTNRNRIVVVFVLALSTGDHNERSVDSAFIERQLAYVQLMAPILTRSKVIQHPDLIGVFVNKIDILTTVEPAQIEYTRYTDYFDRHISLIKSLCSDRGIPLLEYTGSAMKGWGTASFMSNVANKLSKG